VSQSDGFAITIDGFIGAPRNVNTHLIMNSYKENGIKEKGGGGREKEREGGGVAVVPIVKRANMLLFLAASWKHVIASFVFFCLI